MGEREFMIAGLRRTTLAALGITVLAVSISCGDLVRQGRSPSFLVIDLLQGASGAAAAQFTGVLQSDVVTVVNSVPTIFEDMGSVTLRILLKDQGSPVAPAVPSLINAITVNRYRVTYRRADGRNTPGVDVPYPFDGAMTATVTGSPVGVTFTLVRAQAKLEAPLRALAGGGGRIIISTIAEVTFYGHDQAGNQVAQTGSINVNFADWADPE